MLTWPKSGETSGALHTETGFAGASTPNATGGFAYLRNRWYDPQTGRFLTQDPIGLAGGVNLYSYAGNNPVAYTDPFGLCIPVCAAALLVAKGIAIGVAVFGGTRIAYNAATGRPLEENLQRDVTRGAVAGFAGGTAASVVGASGLGATAVASEVGPVAASAAGAFGARAEALANLKTLGPQTVGMLREFFKTGEVPKGLTAEGLQAYRAVAEQAVRAGIDKLGRQAQRIEMIDEALKKMQ